MSVKRQCEGELPQQVAKAGAGRTCPIACAGLLPRLLCCPHLAAAGLPSARASPCLDALVPHRLLLWRGAAPGLARAGLGCASSPDVGPSYTGCVLPGCKPSTAGARLSCRVCSLFIAQLAGAAGLILATTAVHSHCCAPHRGLFLSASAVALPRNGEHPIMLRLLRGSPHAGRHPTLLRQPAHISGQFSTQSAESHQNA